MEIIKDMNYSTNVVLTPEENQRFQVVYAGQRYETFYGIFAKFSTVIEDGKTTLKKIDFRLINYKGTLNIVIDDIAIDANAREKKRDIPVILVRISIMAATQKITKTDTNREHSFLTPVSIPKDSYFSVYSDLLSLSAKKKKKTSIVNGVFDNEFYYRDGLLDVEKKVSDIPLNTDGINELGYDFDSEIIKSNKSRFFGSIRCRVGNSKIII